MRHDFDDKSNTPSISSFYPLFNGGGDCSNWMCLGICASIQLVIFSYVIWNTRTLRDEFAIELLPFKWSLFVLEFTPSSHSSTSRNQDTFHHHIGLIISSCQLQLNGARRWVRVTKEVTDLFFYMNLHHISLDKYRLFVGLPITSVPNESSRWLTGMAEDAQKHQESCGTKKIQQNYFYVSNSMKNNVLKLLVDLCWKIMFKFKTHSKRLNVLVIRGNLSTENQSNGRRTM